ncbi:MAG TPA: hypothetical protein VIJ82_19255 [Streptosporangiaceae bacterium]|jgi:hypothetical protein
MTAQAADRALIDKVSRHAIAGHANSRRMTLVTKPRLSWPRLFASRRPARDPQHGRPGSRLVGTAAVLLFVLGAGLLSVSYAAQYRYVLEQRHQAIASLIEAGALDVGLIIFSLLALGLARAGLAAKTERVLVVLCAAGSALMNYAAADITSPRSVLAFCMPPVFLAVVADRVAATMRRHVLGMQDGRSPWAVLGTAALYGLRLFLAFPSTCGGLRRWILAATPLPAAGEASARPAVVRQPRPAIIRHAGSAMGATKTGQLLALVAERHGALADIPAGQVSKIATALAPEVGLHPASGRTALLRAVRAARSAAEGDSA